MVYLAGGKVRSREPEGFIQSPSRGHQLGVAIFGWTDTGQWTINTRAEGQISLSQPSELLALYFQIKISSGTPKRSLRTAVSFLSLQPGDVAHLLYRGDNTNGVTHNASTLLLAPDPADVLRPTGEGKHAQPISFLEKQMTPRPSLSFSTSLTTRDTDSALRTIAAKAHTACDSSQNDVFLSLPPSPPSIPCIPRHQLHTDYHDAKHRSIDDDTDKGNARWSSSRKRFPLHRTFAREQKVPRPRSRLELHLSQSHLINAPKRRLRSLPSRPHQPPPPTLL